MKLRAIPVLILLILASAFTPQSDDGIYKSAFTGEKIAVSPFGDYIKEELPGNQVIMVVSYGCSHCWDATVAISKLKKEKLISNIIVLGTGTADEKAEFKKETGTDYKMVDYDFETLKNAIKISDPLFPPPPFAIWVQDNEIKAVFTEMPAARTFKKIMKED